ncbi:2-dehydropantoate 2-reductase [Phreatobacter oligotrophus]|uniref:2-dehydropantoate 2-reductase n=1 Tax=Phreatobacter oligotrophus TaxID=1122261 RepID=UPI002356E9DE|nr:2-dehydropantoate 2-reductase [Phreatobacter oligotrophus]MBX9990105.1 2-dehydropantoate 2-reductase [Phreatobacter oligotrophus]
MAQRFVIVGAGAIGCFIGGKLALGGAEVVFVARGERAAGLRTHGLGLADLDGTEAVLRPAALTVVETPAEAASPADTLVLLCTKSGATPEAAAAIGAAFPAGTPVLSLQNGIDNPARIAAAAPHLAALAGMVPFNVTLDAGPNGRLLARRTTSGDLRAADHAATRAALPAFAAAGLPLTLAADMAAVQWGKLLLNLNNPVNALSGLPLRDELMDRAYRRILAALQDEALAAMKAAGLRPAKVGAAPPALIPTILRLPTFLFSRIAASMLTIGPTARSSMADDLAAGRPTEIDDLCGAVVRLASGHGRAAPLNAAMIRLIEAAGPGTHLTGADLVKALGMA